MTVMRHRSVKAYSSSYARTIANSFTVKSAGIVCINLSASSTRQPSNKIILQMDVGAGLKLYIIMGACEPSGCESVPRTS